MSADNLCSNPERLTSLNRDCFCVSLDESALNHALETELGTPGLYQLIKERCPYLFSAQPLFVSQPQLQSMQEVTSAVESVVNSSHWRERVLDGVPAIARHDPGGPRGVFMGYDFHIGEGTVGLIEINTNAGGALLNAVLARAQRACCPEMSQLSPSADDAFALESAIIAMFRREWQLANRNRPLSSIAIVDESPAEQYLYPEFVLFRELFQRHGIKSVIAAPEELEFRDGSLWTGDLTVDMVYNRLTDFLLEQPNSATLHEAYAANAVVLTPHPQAHRLYADKRNLALLTNPAELEAMNVSKQLQAALLAGIPHTELVTVANAERLWTERKKLFFKPAAGYGGKATWRGAKTTKRVWREILAGDYVAQTLIPPGERHGAGDRMIFKYDLRNFVYDGNVQWVAARLYQGQTTNFRTPGGGFAPVYSCKRDLTVRVAGNPRC